MRLFTLIALTSLSAQAKPLDLKVQERTLSNGLQVVSVERFAAPTVSVQLWVRTGSRHERPGITGIAHLFEHMMFKGSKNLGPEKHAQEVMKIGGQLNAYTTHDATVYYEDVAAQNFDAILALEAERFQHLALSESMLESEREVVKEERRMRTDNSPTGTLIEAFFGAAYKAHNYRWPVVGWMKDLDAINLKDCQDFFNIHYNPKNVTVLIVGAIDHETAFKRVEHHFGAWQAQPRSEPTPQVEPELTSRREETVRFATNTPLLLGGWKVPAAKHEDIVALKLLGKILSDGASSRMYRSLVYEQELAQYAAGDVLTQVDNGQFYLWSAARPSVDIDQVEAAMLKVVEQVKKNGVTPSELKRAQAQAEAESVAKLKKAHGIASLLGWSLMYHGDWRPALTELDRLRAVQPEDVQRVAKTYLAPDRMTVVKLLPEAKEVTP
ncbi:MAG: pitrilysin family protein [Myxococcota bacterium]|nr:pitrilysin family protein [Myxococcota bacterium]